MDNNRFIGFTLIMLLILTYYTFFPPGQIQDSENISEVNNQEQKEEITENIKFDDKRNTINEEFLGKGIEEVVSLENDLLKVDFNTKGAKITNVTLSDYYDYENNNVKLHNSSSNINLKILSANNLNLDDIIFDKIQSRSTEKNKVTFSASSKDGRKITIQYELEEDSYIIESKILLNELFNKKK